MKSKLSMSTISGNATVKRNFVSCNDQTDNQPISTLEEVLQGIKDLLESKHDRQRIVEDIERYLITKEIDIEKKAPRLKLNRVSDSEKMRSKTQIKLLSPLQEDQRLPSSLQANGWNTPRSTSNPSADNGRESGGHSNLRNFPSLLKMKTMPAIRPRIISQEFSSMELGQRNSYGNRDLIECKPNQILLQRDLEIKTVEMQQLEEMVRKLAKRSQAQTIQSNLQTAEQARLERSNAELIERVNDLEIQLLRVSAEKTEMAVYYKAALEEKVSEIALLRKKLSLIEGSAPRQTEIGSESRYTLEFEVKHQFKVPEESLGEEDTYMEIKRLWKEKSSKKRLTREISEENSPVEVRRELWPQFRTTYRLTDLRISGLSLEEISKIQAGGVDRESVGAEETIYRLLREQSVPRQGQHHSEQKLKLQVCISEDMFEADNNIELRQPEKTEQQAKVCKADQKEKAKAMTNVRVQSRPACQCTLI